MVYKNQENPDNVSGRNWGFRFNTTYMKLTCVKCGHTGIPKTEKSNIHIKATCFECGSFIKFLPQNSNDEDFILYFGKYKGRSVKSMVGSTTDEFQYLKWLLAQDVVTLKNNQVLILQKLTK